MEKKWVVADPINQQFANQFPAINPVVLQLLANRGITAEAEINQFLKPDYQTDVADPFLFIDMEKAAGRILQAIAAKEAIVVYGDYDADGVCSTAIMSTTIKALGGQVSVYIPFRDTEGYGLNLEAARELIAKGVGLVVTVDCGTSNVAEVAALQQAKVDVIITDHHEEPLRLPAAFAIINPNLKRDNYPFRYLAGSGVAYKVAQALLARHGQHSVTPLPAGWEKWLLDLVAVGTIADLMPLLNENRTLVRYGLTVLQKTKRLGFQQLAASAGTPVKELNERAVGFQIAPRLNAAGRLNHASTAYKLLITEDPTEAAQLASELNATNQERQRLTEQMTEEAKQLIGEVGERKLLWAIGDNWPTGIVGLIAGRIADRQHRPTLIISRKNGECIGSGRSVEGFDITAALRQCDQYLARYGGHSQACGFTIKDEASVQPFLEQISKIAETQLGGAELSPLISIDAKIQLEEVTWDLLAELEKFVPFGSKNPRPRFLATDISVQEAQKVGADGKHLKLTVSHLTAEPRKLIGFFFGEWEAKIERGSRIDIVFEVDVNEWNGRRELQLKIVDLKRSDGQPA